jgi:hypothetical protein
MASDPALLPPALGRGPPYQTIAFRPAAVICSQTTPAAYHRVVSLDPREAVRRSQVRVLPGPPAISVTRGFAGSVPPCCADAPANWNA